MILTYSILRHIISATAFLLVAGWLSAGPATGQEVRMGPCEDRLSLSVRNASIQDVLDKLAERCDLEIIQQNTLDDVITLGIEQQSLSVAIGRVLQDSSYQLYQRPQVEDRQPANILWIFDEGTSVAAGAAYFLEGEILHGDRRSRRQAVRGLRKLASAEAVAALSIALSDEDQNIQIKAIQALTAIGGEEALAALASAAANGNSWVRGEAVNALAAIGGESAESYLQLAMQDADSNVRATVLEAYADSGGENSAQALALALQDPDSAVRLQAVEALEEVGGFTAMQALYLAQADDDPEVKEAAEESYRILETQK